MDAGTQIKGGEYGKIYQRYDNLREWGRQNRDDDSYLMEMDSIAHFFGAGGTQHYEAVASYCKEHRIQRVVDIGCAYGHQSEIFLNEGISYLGVCDYELPFWNSDQFEYAVGRYPCELPLQKGDLAVSILCLTWNVYLIEGEKTMREQCEALARDFDHCLLHLGKDAGIVSQYFAKTERTASGLYYFSNIRD